jgi:hypothetical protein
MKRKEFQKTEKRGFLSSDERGAIMLIALFFAVFLTALLFSVVGTARAIFLREHLQDAVDGAVLSGAILNAQAMNLIVLANIVMAALLAILVALKAVEGLCIIAIGICVALAWFTGGSTLGLIPMFNSTRSTVSNIHEQFKSVIFPALETLNNMSDVIKQIAPTLAIGGAEARLLHNGNFTAQKGIIFGTAKELPVEDDEYSVLCQKSEDAVCKVVLLPFEGLDGSVHGPIESACKGFAHSLSSWFCGDEAQGGKNGDFPISRRQDVLYPRLEQTKLCERGDDAACKWLASSGPDDFGNCANARDCDAYEVVISEARKQCNPETEKNMKKYTFQTHRTSVVYTFNGKMWQRGVPLPGKYSVAKESKKPPCQVIMAESFPYNAPTQRTVYRYETKVHPDFDPKTVLPVCSNELPPPVKLGQRIGDTKTVEFAEVSQILGCGRTEDVKVPIKKSDEEKSTDKSTKSPKRIREKTNLGDEAFFLRGIAWTKNNDTETKKIVELAKWGKSGGDSGFTRMLWLSRFTYAKAEYFYDGDEQDRGGFMWNMRWKARLRRFTLPKDHDDATAMTSLCVGAIGNRCSDLVTKFFETDLAAH